LRNQAGKIRKKKKKATIECTNFWPFVFKCNRNAHEKGLFHCIFPDPVFYQNGISSVCKFDYKIRYDSKARFTLGVKAEIEKIFSICPELVINAELFGLVLAPRMQKGYHEFGKPICNLGGPIPQHLLIS